MADREEAESAASDGAGSRAEFDALAYFNSSGTQRRSAPEFFRLAGMAVKLARASNPGLFTVVAVLQVISLLLVGAQVYLGKLSIEQLINVSEDSGSVLNALAPLVGLIATTVASNFLAVAQSQLQRLLGEHVQRRTWDAIVRVSSAVPLETFESHAFFDALQRAKTMSTLHPLRMATGLFSLVGGLLGVIGLAIAVLLLQPPLLVLLVIGALPQVFLSRKTGQAEFAFSVHQTTGLRLRSYLADLLTGREEAKEVRAYGLADLLTTRWRRNYDDYVHEFRRHILRTLRLSLTGAAISALVLTAAFAFLIWRVHENALTLAGAGATLLAIRLLSGRLQSIASGLSVIFESGLFLDDYRTFVEYAPSEPESPRSADIAPFSELTMDGLSFSYPGTDRQVLTDITFSMRRGEVVALVGENGSGKTTLAKIIAGLFAPTGGTLLWDGVDVSTLQANALRERVGVVFQDFVRYLFTARENIGFGRPSRLAENAEIEVAAQRAGASSYIEGLPQGYDTQLGREFFGGYDLSGGQWQRVALARAFFRDADLLILDEPTAALDARSEHELFQYVAELAADRTVLLISHRFSTVMNADKIVVLHAGEIVEMGSHDELMSNRGRYAELFDLQIASYQR